MSPKLTAYKYTQKKKSHDFLFHIGKKNVMMNP